MKRRRWLLGALVVLMLPFCGSPVCGGTLVYPLLGNMDVDEGTLEFWFVPMVNLYPTEAKAYVTAFPLFSFENMEDFHGGGGWYRHRGQLGFKVSLSSHAGGKRLLPVLPGEWTPTDWLPGEPHHIAFIWRNTHMQVFLDGRLHGSRGQAEPFTGKIGTATLFVGGQRGGESGIILQAIRISSIARGFNGQPEAPKADAATLLLDIFDGKSETNDTPHAQVIAGLTGEVGAKRYGVCRPVQSPVPGLALYTAPKQVEEKRNK